ncbi:MAG TPA: T9SS type A sorting domain-containing protein [Bacteroidia bacterium]|jgi:hypothetical protein|nr:T9SS type A sorting domain-containing protein [Bacteroidia bacterium]
MYRRAYFPVGYFVLVAISILLFFSTSLQAQHGFQKTFGGNNTDASFGTLATSDKGVLIAGYTSSFGAGRDDVYLVKMDSAGTVSWAKTIGGHLEDFAFDIQPTNDSGYILTGYTDSWGAGGYDVLLIKTDASGDTLWTKTYGGALNDFGNSVQQTSDGGYIIAGYTLSYPSASDSSSAYLIRTDAGGNLIWSTAFGGPSNITDAYSVRQTPDKGFVVTGYTNAFGEINGDVFLTKTDSTGHILFTKTYGGTSVDWGTRVFPISTGYLLSANISTDTTSDTDPWLIWTNLNGDTLSTRSYGGHKFDYNQDIQPTSDGGYVMTGYESSFGLGAADGFLMRLNAAGDTLFTRLYGSKLDDELNAIRICPDKGFIMTGFSSGTSTTGNSNLFAVRTDSLGKNACATGTFPILNRRLTGAVTTVSPAQRVCATQITITHPAIGSGGSPADLCTPLGIVELKSISYFECFPNPARDILSLRAGLEEGNYQLQIINGQGQLLYSEKIMQNGTLLAKDIHINAFPDGIYFLRLSTSTTSSSKRFLIQK